MKNCYDLTMKKIGNCNNVVFLDIDINQWLQERRATKEPLNFKLSSQVNIFKHFPSSNENIQGNHMVLHQKNEKH